jgi:glucose-6-phosphate 1-dehydrogenase
MPKARMPGPATLVLFGATSDLARSKLWPALHDLAASGRLPEPCRVLGISRSATSEALRAAAGKHGPAGRLETTERWEALVGSIQAVNGSADDPGLYERLQAAMAAHDGDTLTYLSVAPALFSEIAGRLAGIGLGRDGGPNSRVVIEKPFGQDLESAHALHEALHAHFGERQIFRIDHYLGKETVQNLLVLRFANGILEPIWDRHAIDHVQITVAESDGVDGRGEFYDATGALRDVGQNHLMQLLAFTAMDPPSSMRGEDLQRERLKLLRSVIPVGPRAAVLGQYEGYRDEAGVASGSRTDTYAALRVEIDSWRWAGVPFYLRTGKRLAAKSAEVVIVFRPAPHSPFGAAAARPSPNRLVIGIQPGERVTLQMSGKRPGDGLDIVDVGLEFDAGESHDTDAPEAYERLLGDAFAGDRTLFTSGAEVEAQWAVISPLLDTRPTPVRYAPGSEGPDAAADLPARDGRRWRPLNPS